MTKKYVKTYYINEAMTAESIEEAHLDAIREAAPLIREAMSPNADRVMVGFTLKYTPPAVTDDNIFGLASYTMTVVTFGDERVYDNDIVSIRAGEPSWIEYENLENAYDKALSVIRLLEQYLPDGTSVIRSSDGVPYALISRK